MRAARSRFAAARDPVAAFSFIVAKRPISSPAQNARPSPDNTTARRPFSRAEPVAGRDQRLEHRGIERIHLVGADQPDIGNAVRHRDLDAIVHEAILPAVLAFAALQKGVGADLVNQLINSKTTWESDSCSADKLLAGRRILVTGGGTGLGKAMAARFLNSAPRSTSAAAARCVCDETAPS